MSSRARLACGPAVPLAAAGGGAGPAPLYPLPLLSAPVTGSPAACRIRRMSPGVGSAPPLPPPLATAAAPPPGLLPATLRSADSRPSLHLPPVPVGSQGSAALLSAPLPPCPCGRRRLNDADDWL